MGIAVLIIGLNDNDKRIIFLGPIFFSIGYIATETTITIVGLACLYFLLYQYRSLVKNYRSLLLGMALGCLLVKYCNRLFYETNTEYAMHGGIGEKVSLSSSVLKENLTMNAAKLLNTFSLINISTIPVVLIVLIVGIIFAIVSRRDWRMAIIFGCMIAGSVIVMSLPRTLNFYDNLFFSQARRLI